jgi:hypothetical protein
MQVIIFKSPSRSIDDLIKELGNLDIKVIDSEETFGKDKFWMRWQQAIDYCLSSKHDNYLMLHDDISSLDLKMVKEIHEINKGKLFTCSIFNDGRKSCWNNKPNKSNDRIVGTYILRDLDFFDCAGLSNRMTLKNIKLEAVPEIWLQTRTSSGVGYQLTTQLRKIKAKMYTTEPALCYHGDHDSVMHYELRKRQPLISKPRMKVIIGIATYKGREPFLKKTIKSLIGQADQIRIYDNEKRDINLTDNGKFFFLQEYTEPVYYLSCDDDIIYPPTYVKDMIKAIDKHKCIVTHHGRILTGGKGANYYRSHKAFRCLGEVSRNVVLDVAGTGVTGFRTDYFNPSEIWKSEDKKMSDLVFSLEAKKQGKQIMLLTHPVGYLKDGGVPVQNTIFGQHSKLCPRQNELADSILGL